MGIPQRVREEAEAAEQALQELANPQPAAAPGTAEPPPTPTGEAPPAAPAAQPPAPTTPAPTPPPATPTVQPTDTATELQRLHQLLATEQGRRAAEATELSRLKEQLAKVQQQVQSPPKPPEPPLITEADKKDFGEDMIDFVSRMIQRDVGRTINLLTSKLNTIEGQLRQLGQTVQTTSQSAEELAADRYFSAIAKRVPNWAEINELPAFVDWLKNRATFGRKTRHELLLDAHNQADADTVAEIFEAYLKEHPAPAVAPAPGTQPAPTAPAPTPEAASVNPADLVAPSSANAPPPSANPRGGKIWTQAEIEKVYDDRVHNRITPKVFAEREAEALRAVAEGRVQL